MLKVMQQAGLAMALALGMAAQSVQALEITINNKSSAEAVFAFSYLERGTQRWVVDGWYNAAAHSSGVLDVNSDNDVYYLYAELESGRAISDPRGIALAVADTPFYYAQDEGLPEATRTVRFVRTSANNGKAQININ